MPSRVRRFYNVPNFTHQAYRYGIALSCIGVLLNWLGVAQAYIEPIRYIGVSLVVIGSFLIISALCRWMFLSPSPTTVHEVNSEDGNGGGGGGGSSGDLHVITVPMGRSQGQSRSAGMSSTGVGKPPDYFMVTEKPPSYEEAMSMLPPYPGFLQLSTDSRTQEEYLAPHQVPESRQPEGATGTLLWQREGRLDHSGQDEAMLGVSLIPHSHNNPPAYSSQASLSDFTTQNVSPRSDTVISIHTTTPDYMRRNSARSLYTNDVQENTHSTQTSRSALQESTHSTQTDTHGTQQDTHSTQTHRSDSEENIHNNTHVNNSSSDDLERVSLSDSKCKTPDITEDDNNKAEEQTTKSLSSLDTDGGK